ncbi:MAG: diguanylate cyclase [Desulfobulbaceae bacterium]|nr:diguanylate cyclase [Desulfobulbaceae bacterium]
MQQTLTTEYTLKTGNSYIDSLTGLLNCGFFQTSMDHELQRCKQEGLKLTLALVDVDGFSNFNRENGSLAGDCLLKEIAEVIEKHVRQVDLVSRYSGDVYALLMIDTEQPKVFSITHLIKQAVENNTRGQVTVSIGIASFPIDAVDSLPLLNKAFKALKKAKLKGKNKTYLFENKTEIEHHGQPAILIVDDDPRKIKLIEAMLLPQQYSVYKAENGEIALSIVKKIDIDLILLDIMMPVINGYEVCRRLKHNRETRLIPVVMITTLDDSKSKVLGIEAGADDFISMPLNKSELIARTQSLIQLKRSNDSLADVENILFSLANTVEARDGYTLGHVERVSDLAVKLGGRIDLSPKSLEALRFGGILHDIGKIVIPDNILIKQGKLRGDEFLVMQTHAERGWEICLPLKKNLGEALEVIRYHHEKLDGSGYPRGLKGDEIPIVAQVMTVVDIYDALSTDRPYRKALAMQHAFSILRDMAANGKLNPAIVEEMIVLVTRDKNILCTSFPELPQQRFSGTFLSR